MTTTLFVCLFRLLRTKFSGLNNLNISMGDYFRKFQSQKDYLKTTFEKKIRTSFETMKFVFLPSLKVQKNEKEKRKLFLQQCK